METNINEIEINGIKYVKKGSEEKAVNKEGLEYVVVRADRAGVFSGYLLEKQDTEVTLVDVRHLWSWAGAVNCSQLAREGTSDPSGCKFTAPNKKIIVKNWIEILPCTLKAKQSLEGVKAWIA
jgi:hypothetical protein